MPRKKKATDEPAKEPKPIDPRFVPFRDWAYETFFEERGVHLILNGANLGSLIKMLASTTLFPEYDLDHLKAYWLIFIRSGKTFDREVPNPLRFFCTNIERYAGQATVNDNSNLDAARAFVRRNLK